MGTAQIDDQILRKVREEVVNENYNIKDVMNKSVRRAFLEGELDLDLP
ncbi:MAG: hypothetical protein ABEJ56_05730 [Candidatus Nanohaloarchaea archaeon]